YMKGRSLKKLSLQEKYARRLADELLRVYLAPCGIGLGHITRAYPIAQELNDRQITTVFSTYLDGLEFAKRNHLPTFEAVPINFKVTNEGAIDFKLTAAMSGFSLGIRTLLRQLTQEIRFMKMFKPDVVFSDSRVSSLLAAWLLRIPVVLMLNQYKIEIIRKPSNKKLTRFDRFFFRIANLGWLFVRTAIEMVWGKSQIILIPDLLDPYTISLGNLAIPRRYNGKIKLIGPIIGNEHRDGLMLLKNEREPGKKPRIYAAVSGPKIERQVLNTILIRALGHLSNKYDVVLSRGEPQGTTKPAEINGIQVFDWIRNQEDYIRESDVIIARAGHGIIMKSLTYGKPMLLIPIPDHTEQYGNSKRAESMRVAKVLEQNKVNFRRLDSLLQELLNRDYSENAVRVSKSVSSLNAVQGACNIIENYAAH
ncbi:MAG TPA: glycosyltransferase, partial [Candidatus Bathyarchaeia archaeon]|nr:glycosyltransferase [Candidatus Bathyarchaeia archaeon]